MTASEVTVTEDSYTIEITDQSDNIVEVTPSTASTVEVSREDTTVEVTGSPTTVVVTEQAINTVEVDEPSHVIVHTAGIGSGLGGFYNQAEILALIEGSLSWSAFSSAYNTDLVMLSDFWTRVGNQLQVYTGGEATALETTLRTYSDTLNSVTMLALNAQGDEVDLNATQISQTSGRIDLMAVDVDQHGLDIISHTGTLSVQAGEIAAVVSDVSTIDGVLSGAVGQISVQAGLININASDILTVDGKTVTNSAAILVNTDSITSYITKTDENTGNITSLSVELTATSAQTTINQTSLAGTQAEVESVQTQLADFWGVKITEVNGVPYVTSMGLSLHTDWIVDTVYLGDDTLGAGNGDYIYWPVTGTIWRCILGHTASVLNAPGIVPENYWVEDLTGKKSTFRVDAELFEIYDATDVGNEQKPLFQVSAGAVTLGYDVALQSDGWGAGDPGYSLDASAGTVQFRDVDLLFTDSDAKNATLLALGSPQFFTSTPLTSDAYKVGDLWDRGSSLFLWTCITPKVAGVAFNVAHWEALANKTYISGDRIYGVSAGGGTYVDNTGITVDDEGKLVGIGTANIQVDNSDQQWQELQDSKLTFTNGVLALSGAGAAIDMTSNGSIHIGGKADYSDTAAGVFLGYDASELDYVLNIGDTNESLKWDGANLIVDGSIIVRDNVVSGGELSQFDGATGAGGDSYAASYTSRLTATYDHLCGTDEQITVYVLWGFNSFGAPDATTTMDYRLGYDESSNCGGGSMTYINSVSKTGYACTGSIAHVEAFTISTFTPDCTTHCGVNLDTVKFYLECQGSNFVSGGTSGDYYIVVLGAYR